MDKNTPMVNKKYAFIILMLVLVVVALLFSLISGTVDISYIDTVKALFGNNVGQTTTSIIRHLRFPHSIMICITGAGLAVSGCVFQGILKNPLADPFTLGISSGAVFGVAIAFISGLASITSLFITGCAFLGSLLSTLIVYLLSMYKKFGSDSMVLSGVITSYMFSAAVMLIFALSPGTNIQSAFTWLMGTLSIFDERMTLFVAIIVILGLIVLSLSGNIINAVSLGGEKSRTLGINIEGSIKFLFLTASFITAATVSVYGIIGFVGLITPHIMRKIVGTNNMVLIPFSAFAGVFFLLTCDTLARTLFKPMIIPVGVITNIIGGSFFVFLLLKKEDSVG